MKGKRYTITLPDELHRELVEMAESKSTTTRGVVVSCLKLGLLSFKCELKGGDLVLRESTNSEGVSLETKLLVL